MFYIITEILQSFILHISFYKSIHGLKINKYCNWVSSPFLSCSYGIIFLSEN